MRLQRAADAGRRLLCVVALAALGLAACDALGNPPRRFRTPETVTQIGPLTLSTRTETVPTARAAELMRRIEGRPHYVDEQAAAYLTLVVVELAPRAATLPRYVSLATDLDFGAGPAVQRIWAAPGAARPFVAVFGTRGPPVAARTTRGEPSRRTPTLD